MNKPMVTRSGNRATQRIPKAKKTMLSTRKGATITKNKNGAPKPAGPDTSDLEAGGDGSGEMSASNADNAGDPPVVHTPTGSQLDAPLPMGTQPAVPTGTQPAVPTGIQPPAPVPTEAQPATPLPTGSQSSATVTRSNASQCTATRPSHLSNLPRGELEQLYLETREEIATLRVEAQASKRTKIARPRPGDATYKTSVGNQLRLGKDKGDVGKNLLMALRKAVRKLVDCGQMNDEMWFRHQPRRTMHQICKAARRAHPYLRRFEDDWATLLLVQDVLKNRRAYELRKVKKKERGPKSEARRSLSPIEGEDDDDMVERMRVRSGGDKGDSDSGNSDSGNSDPGSGSDSDSSSGSDDG